MLLISCSFPSTACNLVDRRGDRDPAWCLSLGVAPEVGYGCRLDRTSATRRRGLTSTVDAGRFRVTPHRQDVGMPVISSFYGIDIKLYFRDHLPPHFHAFYGEFSVEIAIDDLSVLSGELPRRATSLVRQWGELHREELLAEWERAWNGVHPNRIDPLP